MDAMHPLELSLLLHQALEPRARGFLERVAAPVWWEDTEALHQARVASRRLRAVLRLLDPSLYPGLKRHQKRLEGFTELMGGLRELDVHTQILEELGPELPGPHGWAALEHILELLTLQRSRLRRRLPTQVEDLELGKLAALIPTPDIPYPFQAATAAEAAWSQMEPFVEAIGSAVPEQQKEEDPAALHRLRIQAKKLRYTMEILAPLFTHGIEAPLRELKALQTVLGDHHDYAGLELRLQTLLDGLESRGRRVLVDGTQAILFHLAQERATHYDRFREIADLFAQPGLGRELHSRLGLAGETA